MKRLSAILLVLVMLFAFTACNSDKGTTAPTENTGSHEINWQGLADTDIVGAWQPADPATDEYVLFTPDCKLRVVKGAIVFESDINYGEDGAGIKSAYTDGTYLYGQWTYTVKDGVLTVTYPKYVEGSDVPEFEDKVFNTVDFTPVTLVVDEDFVGNESFVGKWTNSKYADSYEFTEDGYVIYSQDYEDGMYSYKTEIKMTYNFKDGNLVVKTYEDNSGNVSTQTVDYTLEGTKLLFGESDYYLNGEGDPGTTEATE